MSPEEEIVQKKVDELSEHFECVQIFVSRLESDKSTAYWSFGSGNIFARVGHAEQWLRTQDEEDRLIRRRDDL